MKSVETRGRKGGREEGRRENREQQMNMRGMTLVFQVLKYRLSVCSHMVPRKTVEAHDLEMQNDP